MKTYPVMRGWLIPLMLAAPPALAATKPRPPVEDPLNRALQQLQNHMDNSAQQQKSQFQQQQRQQTQQQRQQLQQQLETNQQRTRQKQP
ncbi:DUF2756 domain-containing protein [Candidatus Sodalis endolongispinus]|uniref:DUF2756 domain-containing protein n=1 Tax=Candidatus Sodalis endolongispinus TaxID=2812662 RepID=A0ABS5YB59_9GAMM|nr:DUF2756 domain-containing protein [Candidatus Sodalis endolongispinus]MBT9432183.1 DUF2756 domain-containing protein [Candidatus Sodalis endolongispinus]